MALGIRGNVGWHGFGGKIPGTTAGMTDEAKAREFDKLHPRVKKMLAADKAFIVIGEHEPYYLEAYRMIRDHEMSQGTWTDADRLAYGAAQLANTEFVRSNAGG